MYTQSGEGDDGPAHQRSVTRRRLLPFPVVGPVMSWGTVIVTVAAAGTGWERERERGRGLGESHT